LPEYISLFTGTAQFLQDEGDQTSPEDFNSGQTLCALDLTLDLSEGTHLNQDKRVSIRQEMRFADALPETVNIVAFDGYFNAIEASKYRHVFFLLQGMKNMLLTLHCLVYLVYLYNKVDMLHKSDSLARIKTCASSLTQSTATDSSLTKMMDG